jgi:hypothetical protein
MMTSLEPPFDLDQRALGVYLPVLSVTRLDALAKVDPRLQFLGLLDEQDRLHVSQAVSQCKL